MEDGPANDQSHQTGEDPEADTISWHREADQQHRGEETEGGTRKSHNAHSQSYWTRWKKTAPSNQVASAATVVVAVATLGYLIATLLQWSVLTRQLSQMEGGSRQTDRIIAEARRIADSMGEALKQGKTAAELSERQAKAALDASIAASQLDQRAWVSMEGISLAAPLKAEETIGTTIRIKNTGHTPALEVVVQTRIGFRAPTLDRILNPPPLPAGSIERSGPNSIAPEAVREQFSRTLDKLAQEEVDRISSGQITLYVFGRISYSDVFRILQRHTYFCMFYAIREKPPAFRFCEIGNSMD